ncbi:MAG: preprotein translocase subunit YajC [Lentisphaerae bacterium GWF2_45_14]|nr:MAG: preprotein translocase subunit YajC [Lentisphaerae bacterium GWF2_45_14]
MFGPFGIIIILGIMIFLLFRSQKKEARRRQEMLNSIKTGDKVVTAGGIYGEVTSVKNDSFVVKIADNVKIEVCKTGVNTVVNNAAPAENKSPDYNKDSK